MGKNLPTSNLAPKIHRGSNSLDEAKSAGHEAPSLVAPTKSENCLNPEQGETADTGTTVPTTEKTSMNLYGVKTAITKNHDNTISQTNRVEETQIPKKMSNNKNTAGYADAFAADGSLNQEAITTGAYRASDEKDESGAVSATPLPEAYHVDQNGYEGGNLPPEKTVRNPAITNGVEFVDIHLLHTNPLSDAIYGNAIPDSLLASVMEDGIRSPLVVGKENLNVISGNTRLRVAQQLGLPQVPVLFLEGELTPEEEQNLVLIHNSVRVKSNEMRVREYQCHLQIEKVLAKQRVATGRSSPAKVQTFTPSKWREIAAKKVGVSYTSLDAGLKVVETIEKLTREGSPENAARLKKVLEGQGYAPAKNLAIKQKWLLEDAPAKTKPANLEAKPEQAVACAEALEPSNELDEGEGDLNEVYEVKGLGSKQRQCHPGDEGVTQKTIVDSPDLEGLFNAIDAIEAFLLSTEAEQLSEALKAKVGTRLGVLHTGALLAGITITVG